MGYLGRDRGVNPLKERVASFMIVLICLVSVYCLPDWEEGGGEGGQQQQRGRGEQQGGQRGVPGGRLGAGGGHAGDRGEQVLGRPEVSRSVDTQCREHVTLKNVPDTTSRLKGRARAKPCSSRLRNTNLYLHKQFVKSETMLP